MKPQTGQLAQRATPQTLRNLIRQAEFIGWPALAESLRKDLERKTQKGANAKTSAA